ncbi:protein DSS1 HOMOLOG ON CHROMOSOME V [Cyclospora cayetanensis]|uniref:Protein DSS1 HOMOLOG ON CHROMOSOME V n=1 Tax=Cyclospora cayetanensis TaxID=88456 RepID=A0A6P6RV03_9EIME|nr:protein DSS1 HOMOLOG ON CHROMOSOME V [Cyclospora cayetanensis]
MRKQDAGGQQAQPSEAPAQKQAAETHEEAFDEPDDELEEFDEIGGEVPIDAEVKQWSEDWDAAGWDDEDPDDEFLERLQRELEAFKTNYTNGNPQTRKAA